MSKVYEYYLAMEELSNDAEYQEYLAEIEMKKQEEMDELGDENMPDSKAHIFVKKMLEE